MLCGAKGRCCAVWGEGVVLHEVRALCCVARRVGVVRCGVKALCCMRRERCVMWREG